MARRTSARVVLNRQTLDRTVLAVADGFAEAGQIAVDAADPPDAPPYGVGLSKTGGTVTYVNGRKVHGYGKDGRQPRKPRAVRTSSVRGIVAIVGFGFPGRFQEFGTVRHSAQPFLTPVMQAIDDDIPSIVRRQVAASGVTRR